MKCFESTFKVWEDNCNNYSARLADALNKQRADGVFCDVQIKINNRVFPAHRGVLCAASGYFQGLLDGNFKEHGAAEVDVSECISDEATLSHILDYIYTGKLVIQKENYEQLLSAASFLLLDEACQLIASFLLENLVLENCVDVFTLADRYSLQEVSGVAFEIVSSRIHDYFIHEHNLTNVPVKIIMKLAEIHAFDSVAEEDMLSYVQRYLHNYTCMEADKRVQVGTYIEVVELFKKICESVDNDAIYMVNDTFLGGSKDAEELLQSLRENEPVSVSYRNYDVKQQEVIALVSVQLLNRDLLKITIHAYLTELSKWIRWAVIEVPKKDHRTFKDFIGFCSTGEMIFSTEKRIAFVKRDGNITFINTNCYICFLGVDMECSHSYFLFNDELFSIAPSLRRVSLFSNAENRSEWESMKLAYNLSLYDTSDRSWVEVGEFCSDSVLNQCMEKTGLEITHYPEFYFDVHLRQDGVLIFASLKLGDSGLTEEKTLRKNDGEVAAKVFKLMSNGYSSEYKLMDMQSPISIKNAGARDCTVRSSGFENKLFVQSIVTTDDLAFKPEIVYHSGPQYVYYLDENKWENIFTGNSKHFGTDKLSNVTFTTNVAGKECTETGSIAPSPTLPLFEYKQRRKTEHEQLIRGTHNGRHIDTYKRKVYGTIPHRTQLLPSAQNGAFYQLHFLGPLVTELWQYNVEESYWQCLPPPPVDTNIMHVRVCSMAIVASDAARAVDSKLKTARFEYDNSNHNEHRPFTDYHLKTAHEILYNSDKQGK